MFFSPVESLPPIGDIKTTLSDAPNALMTVVQARVLGYLLLHAPNRIAMEELAKEIDSRKSDFDALCGLGIAFINLFIRSFRKLECTTPYFLERPTIQSVPKDHWEAKHLALRRDGFRCVVSEKYDRIVAPSAGIPSTQIGCGHGVATHCVHIIPDASYFGPSTNSASSDDTGDDSATVSAILRCFGFDFDELEESKIHFLANVLTLSLGMHYAFDSLELWLEETPIPYHYKVKTGAPSIIEEKRITLSSSDPDSLPPPSSKFLALHAFCAKVANLSGARDVLDGLDKELDGAEVLATDGASSEVLNHAIWKHISRPLHATNKGIESEDSSNNTSYSSSIGFGS